jgi:hypothetical protein
MERRILIAGRGTMRKKQPDRPSVLIRRLIIPAGLAILLASCGGSHRSRVTRVASTDPRRGNGEVGGAFSEAGR